MKIFSVVLALVLLGPRASHAGEGEPRWLALQVDAVSVTAQRPGGAGAWDAAKQKDDSGLFCTVIGGGAAILAGSVPLAGAGKSLCQAFLSSDRQTERDPQAPDLFLRLSADGAVDYRSAIAPDTYSFDFKYRFVVPIDAIPDVGVKLAVVDQDGDRPGHGEVIGTFRLSKGDLLAIASGSPPIRNLSRDGVKRLELIVRPVTLEGRTWNGTMDAAKGLVALPFQVATGSTVTVRATGKYHLGVLADADDPTGVSGNESWSYPQLRQDRHGMAMALVADSETSAQFVPTGKCRSFVAAYTGAIAVGINDTDMKNNRGAITFHATAEPPSVASWRTGGRIAACASLAASGPPTGDRTRRLAEQLRSIDKQPILACFDDLKKRQPAASGAIAAKITIDAAGRCTAEIEAPAIFDATFRRCTSDAISAWVLDPALGSGRLTYPLVFR